MMFVSVMSTAAFAAPAAEFGPFDGPTGRNLPAASMLSTKAASDAVSHAKSNIEYMYGTLAANNAVFGTVKGMDDVVNGLVTDIFAGTSGDFAGIIPMDTLKSNVKLYMKDVIGGSIGSYLNEHMSDFTTLDVTRRANATNQTLTLVGPSATAGQWVYTGPNGRVYVADVSSGTNVWYTAGSTAGALAGTATLSLMPNANATTTNGGATYSLAVPASGLSYTGKSFIGGAGNRNYLYTGANGQIYAYNAVTENWRKTDLTMDDILTGNFTAADWQSANVTITYDYDYDPIKYAQSFADAVSDAFNSKQGAANIQAIIYQLYSAKVMKDVNDKLDDLRDDIKAWENGSDVLAAYHFNEGLFFPYAFMNQFDTPETFPELPAVLFAP
jgi:hypothetical protein